MFVHFENKYGREKKHGQTIIIDKYINTKLLADSSTTSITYKLVMLLIKRRKFLVKLSELMFVLKEINIGEKFEFFDLNTQENGKFILCFV